MAEKVLYITDKDGAVITTLKEKDGISDCVITNKQNSESALSFSMLIKSEKYKFFSNAENLIVADGKVYTQLYDGDSVTEKKDTGNKNSAEIDLVERQYLLGKQFITAYNSTTTYDHIDTNMVVILSGSTADLTVNGTVIVNPYEKGTAAYAIYTLLYGSGWTCGTIDVTGEFDLESDKKSILDNIKAVAELWGGILIFDSFNMTVSLRSEAAYQPYNGYAVRFSFNETGLERSFTKNIVTRLYVYGKDNLNIAASNSGLEYLEDYTYTSTPLYGMAINNDITNAGDLIVWGRRELDKLCKPQVCLKVSLTDRSKLEGGNSFEVSDIVDVIDADLSDSRYQARVTEKKYSFFKPWECDVVLGDEEEVYAVKMKYALENADKVNNLLNLFNRISSNDINMSGSRQSMTSYVQLTNAALEAGFKVIGVDGYERTGKTTISIAGIDVYNGGIVIRDRDDNIKIYMDGTTGNIIFSGDLYGASGTFEGELQAATGTFAGALQAATGSFEGEITAESGYIGSWQILDGGIVNTNNALALTSEGEIVAANGNFEVDADGKLTATGASINGAFSASTENSSVEFSDDTMFISFVDEDGGSINSACRISPTEFYFRSYSDGAVSSYIEYSNGTLEIKGKITASSGEIGGWSIENDKITALYGCMVLHADGTIEGNDVIDAHGQTVSGKLISKTGDEKTVISGGRITMWKYDDTIEDFAHEASIYTNSNFDGGVCIEAEANRPIIFGVGEFAVAKIVPATLDENQNVTEEAHFAFRQGTKIYKDSISTKNINFPDGTLLTPDQDVVSAINWLFQQDPGGGDGKLKAIVDSGAGLKIVLTDAAAENPTLQEYQYSYSIRTFTQTITTTATDGDTTTTTTQTVNNQSVEKLYDNRGALLLTAHYSDTTMGTIDYYTDRSGMKIWLGEEYLNE